MSKTLFWGMMTALLAGCASIPETAAELEPLPTTLLPVSPYRAAMTAAPPAADYSNLAEAAFVRMNTVNIFRMQYTRYFQPMMNQPGQPAGLHDYLQHPDDIGMWLAFANGNGRGEIYGRYNIGPFGKFNRMPLGVGFEFAQNYFQFHLRPTYYFTAELSAGLEFEAGDGGTNVYPFCKWATKMGEQALYLEGGFKIWDNADDGVFIKGEYYFDEHMSAGIYFSTDVWEQIIGTFGYRFDNGWGVKAEIGTQLDNFFLQIGGEYRFP